MTLNIILEQVTLEISDDYYELLEGLREEMDEDVDTELAAIVESAIYNSNQGSLQ